jgi:hypothetical protein
LSASSIGLRHAVTDDADALAICFIIAATRPRKPDLPPSALPGGSCWLPSVTLALVFWLDAGAHLFDRGWFPSTSAARSVAPARTMVALTCSEAPAAVLWMFALILHQFC